MIIDPIDAVRRAWQGEINAAPHDRAHLEAVYGRAWDTAELREDFEVLGFAAPLVVVRRRSDGVRGSLLFQHSPRLYYDFTPHREERS